MYIISGNFRSVAVLFVERRSDIAMEILDAGNGKWLNFNIFLFVFEIEVSYFCPRD